MKYRLFIFICILIGILSGGFLLLIPSAASSSSAAGVMGELDTTFNEDGLFGTLPAATFYIYDVLIQPDGKSVAVGEVNTQIFIMRVNENGFADTSFGSLGMVILDLSPQGYGGALGRAVGIQPDGKLVVGGYAAHSQTANDFVIARLNTNGTLDTTFDTDGIVGLGAAGNELLSDLVVQSDGKVMAAGYYLENSGQTGVSVVRLLPTGQLDNTFDGDGIWGTPSDSFVFNPRLAVQSNGKVLIGGDVRLDGSPTNDFFVIRLLSNGVIDTSFNGVGSANITADSSEETLGDMLVEPNGSIVLVGSSYGGSTNGVAIVRLLTTGALDNSFNGDGLLTIDLNNTQSAAGSGVARQPDGKLLVVGLVDHFSTIPGNFFDSFVLRLTSAGQLDDQFATSGVMLHDAGQSVGGQTGQFDQASAVAVQPDGKIIVAGRTEVGSLDYGYLMRLQGRSVTYLPLVTR